MNINGRLCSVFQHSRQFLNKIFKKRFSFLLIVLVYIESKKMSKKRSIEERLQDAMQLLDELNLDQIPTDTLERLWSGEVLETDIEQINVLSSHVNADALQRLIDLFSAFREDRRDGVSSFWSSAAEREFPLKNLVIWLHRIIESKSLRAFLASKFYLILLEIPGSSAYQVFHTFIFRSVLNLLKFWKSAQVTGKNSLSSNLEELSKELSKAKQAKKRGKAAPPKSKPKALPVEAEDAEMEDGGLEDVPSIIENEDEMEIDQSDEQSQAKAQALVPNIALYPYVLRC